MKAPPRLVWRLAGALVATALLSILILLGTLGAFTVPRLPMPGPELDAQRQSLGRLMSRDDAQVRVRVESEGEVREVRLPDETRRLLAQGLSEGPGAALPLWMVQALGLGTGISMTLGLLTALVAARRLARPIEAVSEAAGRMGAGDLSARAPLNNHGRSEVIETATLAQNFNAMAEALEKAEQQRRATFADIAHELRTPLAVIRSRLEALEDGLLPFDTVEASKLGSHADLLGRLVDDLRTLSLADAGQLELNARDFDLSRSLRGWVAGFSARAEAAGVALGVDAGDGVKLRGDPDRLAQMVGNLLENALRYTPAGGRVTVRLRGGARVTLEVEDSGPGLPEDALERVFERFHRLDPARSKATGGSGLGLSIVRALAELHGGRVYARNRPEGGAVFTLELKGV